MNSILESEQFISYCKHTQKSYNLYLDILNALQTTPSLFFRLETILEDLCKIYKCPMPIAPTIQKNISFVVCSYI